jgi:serine/threonine protein phosphatase PrpC
MTRCLGDIVGHKEAGLSCVPDVSEHKMNGDDLMVLLCSDGIWEFVNAQEAVGFFREALPGLSPFQGARRLQHWNRVAPPCMMSSAEKLAKHAYDRWIQEAEGSMVDDITVVAALLKPPSPAIAKASSGVIAAMSPSPAETVSTSDQASSKIIESI